MVYTNLKDTVGKIIWCTPKRDATRGIIYVLKVKDVETKNPYCAYLVTDSYMEYNCITGDNRFIESRGGTFGLFLDYCRYDVGDATNEVLAHCKSLLKDSSKYYKLIGLEFSETAIKEVTLEEFQKNFPSYVPPAHTLHSSMKEDLKLVQKIQEGLEKLEKAPNQQNSLIVNKPQIKLSFL